MGTLDLAAVISRTEAVLLRGQYTVSVSAYASSQTWPTHERWLGVPHFIPTEAPPSRLEGTGLQAALKTAVETLSSQAHT